MLAHTPLSYMYDSDSTTILRPAFIQRKASSRLNPDSLQTLLTGDLALLPCWRLLIWLLTAATCAVTVTWRSEYDRHQGKLWEVIDQSLDPLLVPSD